MPSSYGRISRGQRMFKEKIDKKAERGEKITAKEYKKARSIALKIERKKFKERFS